MPVESYQRAISDTQAREILSFLACDLRRPGLRELNRLIDAYIRRIPWESVSRILKRSMSPAADCPRLPAEFWRDAVTYGTGGTCYEDNYAFLSLLAALGYRGYMTVNDMGERRGCHAAIVVQLDSNYLVDVSIPIHCAIPIRKNAPSRRYSLHHTFFIIPRGDDRYEIERTHHPSRHVYMLHDTPVPASEYEHIIAADYGPTGQFLDRVILVKLIGETLWRFNGTGPPFELEGFNRAGKRTVRLEPQTLAQRLAKHFGMEREKIAAALSLVQER